MAYSGNDNAEADSEENRIKKALAKQLKAMQIEEQKKQIIRKFLDSNAYERLMNIRIANPELYAQLLDLLIAMIQNRQIKRVISDAEFKGLLAQLTARPESSIHIIHK